MLFKDRYHAGLLLSSLLKQYRHAPGVVVVGLPRGGVVTAYEVARQLSQPLDIIYPRKIGAPFNSEFAIGAVTETGECMIDQELAASLGISLDYIKAATAEEKKIAEERLRRYRQSHPKISLADKTVIIVDDGLATGATMKAAIQSVKVENAAKIIVAVPVAPPGAFQEIRNSVDEMAVLSTPSFFSAVGQFYEDFSQTSNEEVLDLLKDNRETYGKSSLDFMR